MLTYWQIMNLNNMKTFNQFFDENATQSRHFPEQYIIDIANCYGQEMFQAGQEYVYAVRSGNYTIVPPENKAEANELNQ